MATKITNSGLAIITGLMKATGVVEPTFIGWGTGAGTAAATSVSLFTEKDVDLSTATGTRTTGASTQQTSVVTNDQHRVTGTRTATGAGTVTNAGLFTNSAIQSGSLYLHGDFTGIGLANADAIAFTINSTFASG